MKLDDDIDTHLSKQQFKFRKTAGAVNTIFAMRQRHERGKLALGPNCVHFKAAFDTIWRGAL